VLGRSPVPRNTVSVDEPQVPFRTPRIVLIRGSGAILNTNLSTFLPSWMSRVRVSSPAPLLDFEFGWRLLVHCLMEG